MAAPRLFVYRVTFQIKPKGESAFGDPMSVDVKEGNMGNAKDLVTRNFGWENEGVKIVSCEKLDQPAY